MTWVPTPPWSISSAINTWVARRCCSSSTGSYATDRQNQNLDNNQRWQSPQFVSGWPSSLFLSRDPLAIDSVALDFMVAEPGLDAVWGNVDNYLHEAALAASPPSGTVYDPEGDGIPLASLGVHEHWNNPVDRSYSGNLGLPGGIELYIPGQMTAVVETDVAIPDAFALSSYPNPFNATATLSWTQPAAAAGMARIRRRYASRRVSRLQLRLRSGRSAAPTGPRPGPAFCRHVYR